MHVFAPLFQHIIGISERGENLLSSNDLPNYWCLFSAGEPIWWFASSHSYKFDAKDEILTTYFKTIVSLSRKSTTEHLSYPVSSTQYHAFYIHCPFHSIYQFCPVRLELLCRFFKKRNSFNTDLNFLECSWKNNLFDISFKTY